MLGARAWRGTPPPRRGGGGVGGGGVQRVSARVACRLGSASVAAVAVPSVARQPSVATSPGERRETLGAPRRACPVRLSLSQPSRSLAVFPAESPRCQVEEFLTHLLTDLAGLIRRKPTEQAPSQQRCQGLRPLILGVFLEVVCAGVPQLSF